MDLAEQRRLCQGWRGRRLLACRAIDDLERVIEGLVSDNAADLPPFNGLPPHPSEAMINELKNQSAILLRMILILNDGNVSPSKLNRF